MSSLINQHLLSQLLLKEHKIKNLENLRYSEKPTFFNETFRDYKSVVELPKENNLKFPIESKLEVLHAIEIFNKTVDADINQNNLIEIIFYDASSGKHHVRYDAVQKTHV